MSDLGNKEVMAANIKRHLKKRGMTVADLAAVLNVPPTTVYNWCRGMTYPRIDKIELMAKFFGCMKANLVEEKVYANNDIIAKVFADRPDVRDLVTEVLKLPEEKVNNLTLMVKALVEAQDECK